MNTKETIQSNIVNEKKNSKSDCPNKIPNKKEDEVNELIAALDHKKNSTANHLITEKLSNIKIPIKEEPSEMIVYHVHGHSFSTESEALLYCQSHDINPDNISTLSYIRNFAGRNDVIKETMKNNTTIFYTVVDEDGYGIYNHQRSLAQKTFIWEFNYGSIEDLYSPFRDRGITFENDVYRKVSDRNKQLIKMCSEKKLFHLDNKKE